MMMIALQSKIPLYRRASGFGVPGVRVDGNDVLAVQAVTSWALDRARAGLGPTFIEAFTYRMGAHTTSDDPTKYRTGGEGEPWRGKDPITRTQAWLRGQGAWDDARQARREAREGERGDAHEVDPDAGKPRRLCVAAGRIHVATERAAPQHDREDHEHDERDPGRSSAA